MHISSELLYTDNEKVIVKVSGWEGSKGLGSALAQGKTVEIAEDNAITRLNQRLDLNKVNPGKENNTIKSGVKLHQLNNKKHQEHPMTELL